MIFNLDVKVKFFEAKSNMQKNVFFFASIFSIVLIVIILLVALSSNEYMINLIFTIIISILFACFAIFEATVIYPILFNRLRFFSGYFSGKKIEDIVMIKSINKHNDQINDLDVYEIIVDVFDGLDISEKRIYSLENFSFDLKKKYKVETYQRILIKAEIYD